MTFGSLYAHKRQPFVSTPPLAPVKEYAPFASEPHRVKGKTYELTASNVRTMVQMRRGGFVWRQISERLRYNQAGLSRIYHSLPKHLQ